MAIRNIVKEGDEVLRKKCREVTNFDSRLHALLDDMHDTVIKADGAGIAAPQVGVMRRVVLVLGTDGKFIELINPEITEIRGEQIEAEGCLSVPGVFGTVVRPEYAKVSAQDRFGNRFEIEGDGMLAREFCHEIDHLDGILFIDKVVEYLEIEQE